jgi:phosphoribosylpyrophosphate synthetase
MWVVKRSRVYTQTLWKRLVICDKYRTSQRGSRRGGHWRRKRGDVILVDDMVDTAERSVKPPTLMEKGKIHSHLTSTFWQSIQRRNSEQLNHL